MKNMKVGMDRLLQMAMATAEAQATMFQISLSRLAIIQIILRFKHKNQIITRTHVAVLLTRIYQVKIEWATVVISSPE